MNETTSNKRRRFDEPRATFCVTDLPDVLIQTCLSFVGPGSYGFVAGTCKRFEKLYPFAKKTTWKSAAASVSCAKFCLDQGRIDGLDDYYEEKSWALTMIAYAAASIGQLKVVQWAHDDHSYRPDWKDFREAGAGGHLEILKWGKSINMDWYSDDLCEMAVKNGHLSVVQWIYQHCNQHEPRITLNAFAYFCAVFGQLHILQWIKDSELLDEDAACHWGPAASYGQFHVLEWLKESGYTNIKVAAREAARVGRIDVLVWCREQHCEMDESTCFEAAGEGQLGSLQWLRQNDVPWDGDTIELAEEFGHHEVAEWARANGCPEP